MHRGKATQQGFWWWVPPPPPLQTPPLPLLPPSLRKTLPQPQPQPHSHILRPSPLRRQSVDPESAAPASPLHQVLDLPTWRDVVAWHTVSLIRAAAALPGTCRSRLHSWREWLVRLRPLHALTTAAVYFVVQYSNYLCVAIARSFPPPQLVLVGCGVQLNPCSRESTKSKVENQASAKFLARQRDLTWSLCSLPTLLDATTQSHTQPLAAPCGPQRVVQNQGTTRA